MGSLFGTNVAEEHGIRRAPHWPTIEKHFLASNPRCAACSVEQHDARVKSAHGLTTRGLQVHHAVVPFHFAILLGRPDLELDVRNLIVFCEDEAGVITQDHHLLIGHGRNFRSYLPDAHGWAVNFNGLSRRQIQDDTRFHILVQHAPRTWDKMTREDKDLLRAELDAKLPKV